MGSYFSSCFVTKGEAGEEMLVEGQASLNKGLQTQVKPRSGLFPYCPWR